LSMGVSRGERAAVHAAMYYVSEIHVSLVGFNLLVQLSAKEIVVVLILRVNNNSYFVDPVYTCLGQITSKSVVANLKAVGAKESPVVAIATTVE